MNNLIPPPDILGIPSPVYIFQFLYWLTLVLHFIFMNFILGGTLIIAHQEILFGKKPSTVKINTIIIKVMPVALSFAVTMGVAPLLFVQVLYGQFFYTANVMMGGYWLSIIGLVMAAFYILYIIVAQKPSHQTATPLTKLLLLINALLFLLVAFIYTNNAILTENPAYWPDIYSKAKSVIAPNASLIPRYIHTIIGSVAIAGIWMAFIGAYQCHFYPENREIALKMKKSGFTWAALATVLQMLSGGLYLYSLGLDKIKLFMGNGYLFVGWTVGVASAVFALIILIFALLHLENAKFLWGTLVLFFVSLFGMVMGRDLLRGISLEQYFTIDKWIVRTSHSSLLLFLVTFVAGLAIVGYLLYMVWNLKREEIE